MFKNLTILQRLAIIFVLGTIGGAVAIANFFYMTSVRTMEETQQKILIDNTSDIVSTALEGKRHLATATAVALSFSLEQHLNQMITGGGGELWSTATQRHQAVL